jgi:hypothetical protein
MIALLGNELLPMGKAHPSTLEILAIGKYQVEAVQISRGQQAFDIIWSSNCKVRAVGSAI